MSFQAPKGVQEYVPPRSALFTEAREAFNESARRACYADIETAVFEDTSLFVRGVGESSDVVRKEMYSFDRPRRPRDHAAPRVHRRACCAPSSSTTCTRAPSR